MGIALRTALLLLCVAMVGCVDHPDQPEDVVWGISDTLGNQWNKCTLHEIWWADCGNDMLCWTGKGKYVQYCQLNYHGCGPCLPIPKELQ